jgi:5-methylcytosine-specific restriction protein A
MKNPDITRKEIIETIREYDQKGKKSFLREYRFQKSRRYFLGFENHEYPSKAIWGVAHKFLPPEFKPLKSSEFSGGANTVARKLKRLGFEILIR